MIVLVVDGELERNKKDIKSALKKIDGVKKVSFDFKKWLVKVEGDVTAIEDAAIAVSSLGIDVVSVDVV